MGSDSSGEPRAAAGEPRALERGGTAPSRCDVGQAVLEAIYSVGPILEGIGLNITAWSYADALHVSVLGCPASVPDPWPIAEELGPSLAELQEGL